MFLDWLCERGRSLAVYPCGKRVRWLGWESPNELGATHRISITRRRVKKQISLRFSAVAAMCVGNPDRLPIDTNDVLFKESVEQHLF